MADDVTPPGDFPTAGDPNDPVLNEKRAKIAPMLADSELIAQSPYTVEQWEAIIKVLPGEYLDELFGYLTLEKKQSGE